jgi:uncharacterized protein YhhL (DUF1145 family)
MNVEAATLPATLAPDPDPAPAAGFQRWFVLVATLIGVLLAGLGLLLVWNSENSTLKSRLNDTIWQAMHIAMFCISWLIAWRAGQSNANLSIALALTAIYLDGALEILMRALGQERHLLVYAASSLTYVLGAALFIRASQLFPRQITADRIASSPSFWGRIKATRVVLSALLRPIVLWPVALCLAALPLISSSDGVSELSRLAILGLGILFFYINYRSGDAEVQRKVLWFLAAAIASAAVSVLGPTIRAVLGGAGSESLRTVISVTLNALNSVAQLTCIAAAVFYVGAISPSLVIKKTMVYGLTTALLLFVFASVEVFLHHQIVHFLHVTDTFASSLIGGAFGLAFHPFKHYFEHLLERFHLRRVQAGVAPSGNSMSAPSRDRSKPA